MGTIISWIWAAGRCLLSCHSWESRPSSEGLNSASEMQGYPLQWTTGHLSSWKWSAGRDSILCLHHRQRTWASHTLHTKDTRGRLAAESLGFSHNKMFISWGYPGSQAVQKFILIKYTGLLGEMPSLQGLVSRNVVDTCISIFQGETLDSVCCRHAHHSSLPHSHLMPCYLETHTEQIPWDWTYFQRYRMKPSVDSSVFHHEFCS